MNPEKLKKLQEQVRIGGKGTPRRKKKVVHSTPATDDKKLQSSLKKLSEFIILYWLSSAAINCSLSINHSDRNMPIMSAEATIGRMGALAEQCGAEEICLNCHDPKSLAAGLSDSVKLSRFFDKLIDELGGPENVEEMTGRKGRVIQTDNGQIQYESRSEQDVPLETLNLTVAGKDWLEGFLKRNERISIRKPEATNVNRIKAFNKQEVQKFYRKKS